MADHLIYKLIAAIIIIGGGTAGVWKKLKANNIFMAHPSNKYSDLIDPDLASRGTKGNNPINTLCFSVFLGLAGTGLMIYDILFGRHGIEESANDSTTSDLAFYLFCISLFTLLVVFVYMFINDNAFKLLSNHKYTLKIWVTSVFVPPVIYSVLFWSIKHQPDFDLAKLFELCVYFFLIGNGLGAVIFGTLLYAVYQISSKNWSILKKRLTVLMIAQVLFLTIFIYVSTQNNLVFNIWYLGGGYMATLALTIMDYQFETAEEVEKEAEAPDTNP